MSRRATIADYRKSAKRALANNVPREAEAAARKALELDPLDAKSIPLLSVALERQTFFAQATQLLRAAVERHPDNDRLKGDFIKLLARRGLLDELHELIDGFTERDYGNQRLVRFATQTLFPLGQFEKAINISRTAYAQCPKDELISASYIKALIEAGYNSKAREVAQEVIRFLPASPVALSMLGMSELHCGTIAAAMAHLGTAIELATTETGSHTQQRYIRYARRSLDYARMLVTTEQLHDRIGQPERPKGLVIIMSNGSPQVTFMTTLAAIEARKRGYATVYLFETGLIKVALTGDARIDELQGLLLATLKHTSSQNRDQPPILRNDWNIDLPNRLVSLNSINVYQPIYETMCQRLRRYTIDFNSAHVMVLFNEFLLQCDTMVSACRAIDESLANADFPIRLWSAMPYLVPNVAARIYCEVESFERNMHFVNFMAGYQHYYTNGTNTKIGAVSIANLTKFRGRQRLPIHARREQFDEWLEKFGGEREAMEKAREIAHFNRTKQQEVAPAAADLIERVEKHRAKGQKVVCLFGKILYDVGMPSEKGPAHIDMQDWINHTIEAVADSNVLLLIKPHPNEMRKTFSQPSELFVDLISTEIPGNVVVMQHDWLNIGQLATFLDLAVLWSGTSSLELSVLGVPVLMSSIWGAKDFPINFYVPVNREDYQARVRNPEMHCSCEDLSQRCADLIRYLSTEDIMIPYPYAVMPLRHIDNSPREWIPEELDRYFEQGDPNIDRIVERAL